MNIHSAKMLDVIITNHLLGVPRALVFVSLIYSDM